MKKFIILVVLGILILAGWFYWFQWRPSQIAKYCNSWASDESGSSNNAYNLQLVREGYEKLYQKCLREQGVK